MAHLLARRLEFLYQRMKESGAGVLEFALGSQEKLRIAIGRKEPSGSLENKSQKETAGERPPTGLCVPAPLSGVFYRAPSPSSPAFAQEGSSVAAGDVLCIIEAMKVLNEIKAPRPGIVLRIFGVNGKHVKKGDTLFLLEERQ